MKRKKPLSSKSGRLRNRAISETARTKDEIQKVVRAIVIKRDGCCIFNQQPDVPPCNGYAKDGHLVLQADHLITRANSASYADPRLIVCVCRGHHGWKRWNEAKYNEIVRELIGPERALLWERMHQDRYAPRRKTSYDWKITLAYLKQEYSNMP